MTVRLRARGTTKRYGRRNVLTDINLTVRAGQVAAITGANGSDAGRVYLDGTLGYCPQDGGVQEFLAR